MLENSGILEDDDSLSGGSKSESDSETDAQGRKK
jgi:hypothetical protein